jgi:processive 1,2-diacylglycerol beta-glucosyltransferase
MYSEFSKCAGELCKYVLHRGYDTIVCVHVFASFMVTAARQECGLLARAYFVATDYTCSPGVGDLDMDTFFIPHADLTEEFVSKGVPRERIVASGIPIHKNFLSPCDKASARRALSLPESKRVLLLSSGSMGCGPIERVASRLASSLRQSEMLIVICGTNRPLYNSLKRQISSKNVRIIGYCTRMSEYMSAADVYMTKAGGLSTTEAIMRRLPLLCIDAVGGCETRNLEFMKRLGVAEHGKSVAGLCDLALEYARDERLCFMLADNMEKSFSFNGTENLCRYVMNYS